MAAQKDRKLVIVGDSAFAEIAYEYFTHDSRYEVVGFSVEAAFLKRNTLMGLPIVAFETLADHYSPATHDVYVAIVYTQMNRLRARLAQSAEQSGYALASYISPHAFVWPNVTIGKHCFIFENNVVQAFVKLGDNVVLWSGNHIGHHSIIGDNIFISSHVVVSGFCTVGDNVFLGVNSSVANNIAIAKDCWIGPNVAITKNTNENELYRAPESEIAKVGAKRYFKVKD